jgi:hypothetical protein
VNLEKIRAAAERVARSEGLEVFDIEWKVGKQRFLRVYIDRVPTATSSNGTDNAENGSRAASDPFGKISHADCERVSQQLSVILDVENLIEGPAGYVLEVSSPGLAARGDRGRKSSRRAGRKERKGCGSADGNDSEGEFSGRVVARKAKYRSKK